jgi:hypothetical protein
MSLHPCLRHLRFPINCASFDNYVMAFLQTWKQHISSLELMNPKYWGPRPWLGSDKRPRLAQKEHVKFVRSTPQHAASSTRARVGIEEIALVLGDCTSMTSLSVGWQHSELLVAICKNLQNLHHATPSETLPGNSKAQHPDQPSIFMPALTSMSWDMGKGGSLTGNLAALPGLQELHLIAQVLMFPSSLVVPKLKTLCVVVRKILLTANPELLRLDTHFPNLTRLRLKVGPSRQETSWPLDPPDPLPAVRFPEDLTHLEMDINLNWVQLIGGAMPLHALQVCCTLPPSCVGQHIVSMFQPLFQGTDYLPSWNLLLAFPAATDYYTDVWFVGDCLAVV